LQTAIWEGDVGSRAFTRSGYGTNEENISHQTLVFRWLNAIVCNLQKMLNNEYAHTPKVKSDPQLSEWGERRLALARYVFGQQQACSGIPVRVA
jgi:hypothetical protein